MRSRVRPSVRGALAALALCQCSLAGLTGGALDGGSSTDAPPRGDTDASDAPAPEDAGDAERDAGPKLFLDASDSVDGSLPCGVHSDGKLYCGNTLYATLYAMPTYTAAQVDHLTPPYDSFDCWGVGALHLGNNTTWYRTHGDHGVQGWIAGYDVATPDAFDADPSAYGLSECM